MSDEIVVAILTISDSCFKDQAEDRSGQCLEHLVSTTIHFKGNVAYRKCIPDDEDLISFVLEQMSDENRFHVILTTGGTGFSPRDFTPEATKAVIEREAPGMSIAMLSKSLEVTPMAMLSRLVCGIRRKTLIINLPGSRKAAAECFSFVAPAIRHAIDLIYDRKSQVVQTHKAVQNEETARALDEEKSGVEIVVDQPTDSHLGEAEKREAVLEEGRGGAEPVVADDGREVEERGGSLGSEGVVEKGSEEVEEGTSGDRPESRNHSKITKLNVTTRQRDSPFPMISIREAQKIVVEHASLQPTKSLYFEDALGYVIAGDVLAKDALPPFPASRKDGYCVIAAEGKGKRKMASSTTAGCDPDSFTLPPGCCSRVNTGAPVPRGADAMVMVEDTVLTKLTDDQQEELEIEILSEPTVGQEIRKVGSDIEFGQKVLEKGTRLGPSEIGVLATVGVTEVEVYKKPKIGLLSTGNELQTPGSPLKVGHIRDSNKSILKAFLRESSIPTVDLGIAEDTADAMFLKIKEGFSKCDVVVTTGSVSMGDRDMLKHVLVQDFGATIHFGRVCLRPGKPTTFSTCIYNGAQKLVLGLPGNPVSATVTSHLFLLPLCRRMAGLEHPLPATIQVLTEAEIKLDLVVEYRRVALRKKEKGATLPVAYSTGSQMSSRLLSMNSANALMIIPARSDHLVKIPAGTQLNAIIISQLTNFDI